MKSLKEKQDNAIEQTEFYRNLSIKDRIELVKKRNSTLGGNATKELERLNELLDKPVKKQQSTKKIYNDISKKHRKSLDKLGK